MLTWPLDNPPCCENRRCMRPADCDIDGQPFCLACADELLQRFIAVSWTPQLREQLPELWT